MKKTLLGWEEAASNGEGLGDLSEILSSIISSIECEGLRQDRLRLGRLSSPGNI
jgi:hypothetical protein